MPVYRIEDIISKTKQKPLLEVSIGTLNQDKKVRIDITNETNRITYPHNYRIKFAIGQDRHGTSVGFFTDYDIPFDALANKNVSHIEYNDETDQYLNGIIAVSVILRNTILSFIRDKNTKLIKDKNISVYQLKLDTSINLIFYDRKRYGYDNLNNLKAAANHEWQIRNPGKNIDMAAKYYIDKFGK